MKIHIKPENDNVKTYYSTRLNYDSDSGLDLTCVEEFTINPGETKCIDFKIQCEAFNENGENIAYGLVPRSSTGKNTPLRMSNSFGLIDADYRGNIKAWVDNIKNEPYTIRPGDRLFQLYSATFDKITYVLVDTLSTTERGVNGFGSTTTNNT